MIIEALDAANGDATIIRHTGNSGHEVIGLIDGGPSPAFKGAIQPALAAHGIAQNVGGLDWVAVSHVDSDHIGGVLKLVRAGFTVDGFYFNTPSPFPDSAVTPATTGASSGRALEGRLSALIAALPPTLEVASIPQGQALLDLILQQGNGLYLLNPPSNQRLLTGDTCQIDGLALSIVAPSQSRIDTLLREWAVAVAGGAVPASAERMDTSITNLSSLAFLATSGVRTALFTGDALEDDIVAGLEAIGRALPMHVDVLKVPHHGSNSAANPASLAAGRGLIETVSADHYIVSADGTSTNPALATLKRIVDARSSPCTIWLPSPRSNEATTSARYYRKTLAALERMVAAAAVEITVNVGDGTAQVIDLT